MRLEASGGTAARTGLAGRAATAPGFRGEDVLALATGFEAGRTLTPLFRSVRVLAVFVFAVCVTFAGLTALAVFAVLAVLAAFAAGRVAFRPTAALTAVDRSGRRPDALAPDPLAARFASRVPALARAAVLRVPAPVERADDTGRGRFLARGLAPAA